MPHVAPRICAFLVEAGIDSISLNPDSVVPVKHLVAERECQLQREYSVRVNYPGASRLDRLPLFTVADSLQEKTGCIGRFTRVEAGLTARMPISHYLH